MAKKKKIDEASAQEAMKASGPPRLKTLYEDEVAQKVSEKFNLSNPMQRPRLDKIVLNVNVGRYLDGGKLSPNIRDTIVETLTEITGQKPVLIKAKKSVSNFKVREGMDTAAMVTIRRDKMWHFLDRLINLAIPRIRDFRGLPDKSFDHGGSYSMGLTEQGAFPEIDMANVTFTHGMNINLVFRNSDPEKSKFMLEGLGFPFRRDEDGAKN
jgi:large subunit ribosomal protein L5